MADFTHVHTHSIQAAGEVKSGTNTITAKGEQRRRPTVADGQTVFVVVYPVNVSKLKSLYWQSDKEVVVTPYNGESAGDPITIPAGGFVTWYTDCGWDCPLAADVTVLKVANDSGSLATLDLIDLQDPTLD